MNARTNIDMRSITGSQGREGHIVTVSPPSSSTAPGPNPAGSSPSSRPARSLAPDIARGLMLALIAIANVSWFLWGHEGSVGTSLHIPPEGPVDSAVQFIMTIAVDQRAIPLFTFLFGY